MATAIALSQRDISRRNKCSRTRPSVDIGSGFPLRSNLQSLRRAGDGRECFSIPTMLDIIIRYLYRIPSFKAVRFAILRFSHGKPQSLGKSWRQHQNHRTVAGIEVEFPESSKPAVTAEGWAKRAQIDLHAGNSWAWGRGAETPRTGETADSAFSCSVFLLRFLARLGWLGLVSKPSSDGAPRGCNLGAINAILEN